MFGLFKKRESDMTDTQAAIQCFRQKKFDEALLRANAIIASAPEVALSHRFKGEVLFEMNRYSDCIAAFEDAERLGGPGTEETFFWRALAYANSGQKDKAIEILGARINDPVAQPQMVEKCKAAIAAIQRA